VVPDYPKDLLAFRDQVHSEDAYRLLDQAVHLPPVLTRALKGGTDAPLNEVTGVKCIA